MSEAPPVRYARTPDGVSIAYAVHGVGPPLLYFREAGHLEFEWTIDEARTWYESLGEHFTVIRYDMRGSGMSDRDGDSWEGCQVDAHVVLDAAGADTAMFCGADDPKARTAEIEAELKAIASPFRTAESFNIEEIIDPRDTRPLLCEWSELAYRNLPQVLGPKAREMRP